jgi:hypothetical protein
MVLSFIVWSDAGANIPYFYWQDIPHLCGQGIYPGGRIRSTPIYLRRKKMKNLGFEADIRPLFRTFDIENMTPLGLDLSSYEDVKRLAQLIYERMSAKEMPCDNAWSEEQLATFEHWMNDGMKP